MEGLGEYGAALTRPEFEAASKKAPEASSGLNIEGLAATIDDKLLIGLRHPLPRNRAIVIPLENPDAIVTPSDPSKEQIRARFGTSIPLDLGGRGIRSIERVGSSFIIVAGPSDDDPNIAFGLYRWGGPDNIKELTPVAGDLLDLHPEALFQIGDANNLYFLSDDGDMKIGNSRCKDDEVATSKKFFRGMSVKLP